MFSQKACAARYFQVSGVSYGGHGLYYYHYILTSSARPFIAKRRQNPSLHVLFKGSKHFIFTFCSSFVFYRFGLLSWSPAYPAWR